MLLPPFKSMAAIPNCLICGLSERVAFVPVMGHECLFTWPKRIQKTTLCVCGSVFKLK